MKIFYLLFLVFWIIPLSTNAEDIESDTCSSEDVQVSINLAREGDIISIPSGECIWTDPIVIEKNNIVIQGAGKDLTKLVSNTENSTVADGIFFVKKGTKNIKIKSIGFGPEIKVDSNAYNAAIWLDGQNTDTLVYDCKFDGFKWGVFSWDTNNIVISSCEFFDGGIQVYGDASDWSYDLDLGTKNWLFVEDNVFKVTQVQVVHFILGYSGTKYVFRNNTVESSDTGAYVADAVDAHGYGHGLGSSLNRSTRGWEIYDNYFYKRGYESRAIFLRGGTGVVYNNIFDESVGGAYAYSEIRLQDERLRIDALAGPSDGNNCNIAVADYRECREAEGEACCDMIGRGANQKDEAAYFWRNYKCTTLPCLDNLVEVKPSVQEDALDFIEEGEDYFNKQHPDYTPYAYPHPLTLASNSVEICAEGEIVSSCWCEGIKTDGFCNNGYYAMATNIKADVNQDSSIDSSDIFLILRKSLGMSMGETAWHDSDTTGDVNCNGEVNIQDVLLTMRFALGLNMENTSWCDS